MGADDYILDGLKPTLIIYDELHCFSKEGQEKMFKEAEAIMGVDKSYEGQDRTVMVRITPKGIALMRKLLTPKKRTLSIKQFVKLTLK